MKIKNLNIKTKLLSLALASALTLPLTTYSLNNSKPVDALDVYENITTSTSVSDEYKTYNLDGTVKTTANLNFRTGPTTGYKVIETLKVGTEAKVLGITDSNWFKIKVGNTIGYVSGDYVTFTPAEKTDENGNKISKYVSTTSALNLRTGPGTENTKITTIPKGTNIIYLDRLDNNWYMVKYAGKIGFVSGDYITTINNNYRHDFIKVVYANKELDIKKYARDDSESLYTMSKEEACEVLDSFGSWYRVRCNNQIGYIQKSLTTELTGIFVVVDISEQKLTLYDGNTILLEVDITSGTKGVHDTPYGLYSIQSKERKRYLTGPGYKSWVEYWMPFYYGYGIHDASWRKAFGKNYYVTGGSHGCVNVPPEYTDDIYEVVEVGTKVLVHK